MQRRDFIKISAVSGAVAALEACKNPDHQLIRFIPEEDLTPGVATWKPSICTLCPAGCGLLVRVMQGEAEVVRNGKRGILTMGLAKKLEGNPAHPINRGRLCPRGQAGLQVTYHPDRIHHPLIRTGKRGSGQCQEITWDAALERIVSELRPLQAQSGPLAFLTNRLSGQREEILRRFASAFRGSTISEFALFDDSVIREANLRSFGFAGPPTLDLGRSKYVLSFGADFLGTWNSPMSQSIGYGQMRQGYPGKRAKLVHFESRLSLTAANADEWVPSPPGAEGALALSLAHVILRDKLRSADAAKRAASLIDGWSAGLDEYAPETIEKKFGVPAATVTRIAREAVADEPAVALIGDTGTSQTNGLFNAIAVNALNALLKNIGEPGGILFTPAWTSQSAKTGPYQGSDTALPVQTFASRILSGANTPKVLFLHNANPVFATPPDWKVRDAISRVPTVVSFGNFLDETSIFADLILPDNSPLESWLDDRPTSGSTETVVSLAPPAMYPLHNTRAMPDVLLDIAHRLGGELGQALPWKTYEEALQADFAALYKEVGENGTQSADAFWKKAQEQGGWWGAPPARSTHAGPAMSDSSPALSAIAQFDGSPEQYPFHFLPFASQMLYDGSLAHLPWIQEAPDPLSTVMWGTWVEVNPKTAVTLGIESGDLVKVQSQHGTLQTPVLVTPGIAPGVVAMPVGQGHEQFTRYAKGRGANPISILAPMQVSGTDSLAWSATRVRIWRIGKSRMIVFGGSETETTPEMQHR
jgi:anaerobic selenocysteine-containing dehydrogenase